jgi:TPR repeat protein/uncharacterized caspase-like protein/WD40 repeat protein
MAGIRLARLLGVFAFAIVSICLEIAQADAEKRVALVIGNSNYGRAFCGSVQCPERLRHPAKDAVALAALFQSAGFQIVESRTNVGLYDMRRAIGDFAASARDADLAIVYFSGYGIAVNGVNYLIPTDAALARDFAIEEEAIPLDRVLRATALARSRLVILDAARDNPFIASMRRTRLSIGSGLAPVEPSTPGTLAAFAAKPGSIAPEGEGANSPFTTAILKHLAMPGLDLRQALLRARDEVLETTRRQQEPVVYGSLGARSIALFDASTPMARGQGAGAFSTPSEAAQAWGAVKDTTSIAMLEVFVKRFGDGFYGDLARARIEELKKAQPSPAAAPAPADAQRLDLVTDCDRLAANTSDRQRSPAVLGVALGQIDVERALVACNEAISKYPDVARFQYQFGRVALAQGDYARARQFFERAVGAGSLAAIINLGLLFEEGQGVAQDFGEARRWYEKAAAAGNSSAMVNLGRYYEIGVGVTQDYAAARRWYEKAAGAGDALGMTLLGYLYANGQGVSLDYNEARRWYEKGAAAGDALGMNNIGALYANGSGVTQDHTEARRWYERAASAGNTLAMRNLAIMYAQGQGVAQDFGETRRWLEKASAANDTSAMVMLAGLHAEGSGVPQNYAEARRWLEKASAAGNAQAMTSLGVLYVQARGVAQDYAQARTWFQRGAAANDTNAMYNLGLLSVNGQGGAQDYVEARRWFEKAATAGHVAAMTNLGSLYYGAMGVARDYSEARRWYEKAAAAGEANAMNHLGVIYAKGQGVARDPAQARDWYEKSANLGDILAMRNLADAYRFGEGVAKNLDSAEAWYEKSAAGGDPLAKQNLISLTASKERLAKLATEGANAAELSALRERLIEAGCYKGPIGTSASALEQALAVCPVIEPILSIETGMHTAPIRSIGVDRECRLLATGSQDKTVRVWSLPEGRLLKILRPPVGPSIDGELGAVAVSPDGKLVAAGGWDARWSVEHAMSAYLFDAATGTLRGRIGNFDTGIGELRFSPDGRFLAVGLVAGSGLRVFDIERAREIATDPDYNDSLSGMAFAPDGRLFTVAADGYLRAYDAAFRLVNKVRTRGGQRPGSVAVDPSGERVAVGFSRTPAVEVYGAAGLSFSYAADVRGIDAELTNVAWSADGQGLAAGGDYRQQTKDGASKSVLALWERAGQGPRREQPVTPHSIQHVLPCGTGFAVGTVDPMFTLLDRDGAPRLAKAGDGADMIGKIGEAFQVSKDGRQVWFGLGEGNANPVLLDLTTFTLTRTGIVPGLTAPRIDGVAVTDWRNGSPKVDGEELYACGCETASSLAVTPDGSAFVVGAELRLSAFDPHGKARWGRIAHTPVGGVNITADGRLLLAAHGDGTIHWHRVSDGQELLAVFVNKNDLRWVAWTPSGYYTASPGGEDLIGWHLNRGWDQAADFFPASRFRDRFSRPDVVQKVLETLDEQKAVKEANDAAVRQEQTKPLLENLPPVVRITGPVDGSRFTGTNVEIRYALRSPSGLPVDRVDALLDGRPVETRGMARFEGKGEEQRSVNVPVPRRNVDIALIARSGDLTSDAARLRLTFAGEAPPEELLKPKLYALVIGISDYADANLRLGLAAKDARDFARSLQTLKGGMYGDVVVRLATDHEVTRASVVDNLEWLEKQVTSRDVGLVFLAGHGFTDERQNYWFLPADARPDRLRSMAVSKDDLRRTLQVLAGKALFFLDTCHAGQAVVDGATRRGIGRVDINGVVNELAAAENGVVTFASSTGRELALERADWGNGAFTKAILEGLFEGRADLLHKGTITLSQLDAYVADRVKDLTGGVQHPIMIRPATVPDFPIALVGAR